MSYHLEITGWVRRQLQKCTPKYAIANDNKVQRLALPEKLIIGLGNPGRKYAKNRHNIGFMVVDALAQRHEIEMSRKKHNAYFGTGIVGDHSVVLAKPQTFMNRSGDSVGRIKEFYGLEPADLLIIYDEIDLPFGTLRIREKGGSGGHNGMKSVIARIGQDFARIRLGVDRPPGRMDPADYVLRDFKPEQIPIVEEMIENSVMAIEVILSEGVDRAMTRFNGPLNPEP